MLTNVVTIQSDLLSEHREYIVILHYIFLGKLSKLSEYITHRIRNITFKLPLISKLDKTIKYHYCLKRPLPELFVGYINSTFTTLSCSYSAHTHNFKVIHIFLNFVTHCNLTQVTDVG